MTDMSNEQIIEEFGQLFGDSDAEPETEEQEETVEEPTEEAEDTEEQSEEASEETEETEETEEEQEEAEPEAAPKKQSKQNYAFAQQRQQIKEQKQFLDNLGKLIGMDGAKPEEIQNKVQEVLLAKQSQETNVPVEILQRLQNAERIIQENDQIKLETKVQNSFMELVEKHNLDKEAVDEFTRHLIDNGMNPMENKDVDIEAEYLKLHFQDMIKNAVDEALKKEQDRQNKVKTKAASSTEKSAGSSDPSEINSVADLDKAFSAIDL